MATFPKMETNGTTNIPDPSSAVMSLKLKVPLGVITSNSGTETDGKPAGTLAEKIFCYTNCLCVFFWSYKWAKMASYRTLQRQMLIPRIQPQPKHFETPKRTKRFSSVPCIFRLLLFWFCLTVGFHSISVAVKKSFGNKINKKRWLLLLTRRDKRKAQQQAPKIKSHFCVSSICLKTFIHTSLKLSASNFNPRRFFTCAEAIVIAPAEVKAATTGVDTKSTRKPAKNPLMIINYAWFGTYVVLT